ncbi:MAG: HAAS signaling domain-containing protein [Fimbriimonadaceae bacterium]
MPNLIDWYLVELRLRLNKSLPLERIDEIVREAEGHLLESVQRRVGSGITESAAMEAAIEAYGKPETVALGFLRGIRQSMLGINPMCWALCGAFVAIVCWNFHWLTLSGYFDNFGDIWQNGLAVLVGLLGLGLLMTAVRAGLRSYRFALTGLTLGAAALSVPLISYWMIPAPNAWQGISRFHLSRDLPRVERAVDQIDRGEAFVRRGMREYAAAKSSSDLSPDMRTPALAAKEFGLARLDPAIVGLKVDHGGAYVVPREYGFFAEVNGGLSVLETMARFEDAKKAWSETGAKELKEITSERTSFGALLNEAIAARNGRLFFFDPDLYLQTMIGTVVLLPLFLLLDWIAVRSARPRRRWMTKALA